MKLKTIIERAPIWYEMSTQPGAPAVYLEGPPGVGKTSVLSQLPARLEVMHPGKKFGLVVLNGACVSLTTLSGYLWPTERDGETYSRFTKPDWWIGPDAKSLSEFDGGILIVDEIDKVANDEKKIMGEAALSKRLASHSLPPGWVIWFAGNRASDKSGSTKDLMHLVNRRMTVNVDGDVDSLKEWMEEQGALGETIIFMEENPNIVFPDKVPDDFSPYCTPRSLASFDQYLRLLMKVTGSDAIPTDTTVIEEGNGIMGVAATAQFMATVRLGQELPPYEDIIKKPETIALPARPDAMMLAIYKIAAKVSKDDAAAALKYVGRLPKEFHVNFVRTVLKRDKSMINIKAFREWCAQNASLVTIIAKLQDAV